jgi:ABC-type phosphate transport system permease subunit
VLLPTAWAKEGISCLSVRLPWCKADVEKLEAQKQELTEALIKASEKHWYDNTLLMTGIGLVVGTAVGVGATLYLR